MNVVNGVLKACGAGVLAFGLLAAPAASADVKPQVKEKIGVCHRTASDRHPYVFIVVDRHSADFRGHLAHRNNPARWKHGRRDYIDGLDGSVKSQGDCPKRKRHKHHHHHHGACRAVTPATDAC
ncbi:hypothetical protein [Actinomadura macrotermitis]|uniref:Uncharacterized protein n=1 Tax=Actinomadura macrotermitis TaxID=2585200 RepID=A0A7K0BR73_9ACTN|nr:hypothetical protein [Actinomadura macrotermitis]MQY03669.1 hypothetical protein [Actinomadura macrotermitis]